MATIRKRGDKYQIVVSLGRGIDGKQIREAMTYTPTTTAPTKLKKEFDTVAYEFEKSLKGGKPRSGDKISFEKYVETVWRPNYAACNLTIATQEDYYDKIKRYAYPAFKTKKIASVTTSDIDAIIAAMKKRGLAASTIKRNLVPVSSVFSYAKKKKIIAENPFADADMPKIKASQDQEDAIHFFTVEQAKSFLDYLSQPYTSTVKGHTRTDDTGLQYSVADYTETRYTQYQFRVFFDLAIRCGFRRGELIGLQWRDIDFEKRSISIHRAVAKVKGGQVIKAPKTAQSARTIGVRPETMDLLKEWKKRQQEICMQIGSQWKGYRGAQYDLNHVFIQTDSGEMMYIDTPTQKFKRIVKRYNAMIDQKIKEGTAKEEDKLPDIHLHDLRHTFATLLINSGVQITDVSKAMGHSKLSTTLDIYTHHDSDYSDKVAEAMQKLFA